MVASLIGRGGREEKEKRGIEVQLSDEIGFVRVWVCERN